MQNFILFRMMQKLKFEEKLDNLALIEKRQISGKKYLLIYKYDKAHGWNKERYL